MVEIQRVKRKMGLSCLSYSEIKQALLRSYDLNVEFVEPLRGGHFKNKVYFIKNDNNDKYVFRYAGENGSLAKKKTRAFSNEFFPKIIKTKSSKENIKLNRSLYSLEEYLESGIQNDLENQFSILGERIASLHNQMNSFFAENSELIPAFNSNYNPNSESNILSSYIDLTSSDNDNSFLLHYIKKIVFSNESRKLYGFPRGFIHGDLNDSNIIHTPEGIKFIDLETAKIAPRIGEFVALLLLGGNMSPACYIPNSLEEIIESYNLSVNSPLTIDEKNSLYPLLQFSLIKNHVIRSIRNNDRDLKKDFDNTKLQLQKVAGDKQ